MSRLIKKLKEYDELYYNEGKSPLTDTEYDLLKEKARKEEPDLEYFKEVGVEPKTKKVKLPFVLGSLSKKKIDTVEEWIHSQNDDIVVTSKIDGVSLYVQYNDGKVQFAATRGKTKDGVTYGSDITEKARIFCPEIKEQSMISLRGECVLEGDIYKELGFSNPRNGCAGIINRDDMEGVEYIKPYFHEVVSEPFMVEFNEVERLEFMKENGLNTPLYEVLDINGNVVETLLKIMQKFRLEEPFQMDGLVLTPVNYKRENVAIPKNKVAFKVNEDAIRTKVRNVEFRTTRTGRVVPLVHIEPVEIGGTIVSKATGFNVDFIEKNVIGENAEIGIVKSGDIIPFIEEVYVPSENMIIPTNCPSCNSPLERTNTDLLCKNKKCFNQKSLKIEHFFKTLGVENLSRKTLDKIELDEIHQFFYLKEEELINIEGIGEKKAKLIVNEIGKAIQNITDVKFLTALGIKGIGEKISKLILNEFTLQELFVINVNELEKIKGVGLKLAENLVTEIKQWYPLYILLVKDFGVKSLKKETKMFDDEEFFSHTLSGKSFAITGKHPLKRDQIIEIIENNGGVFTKTITKETQYLIVEDVTKTSKKLQDAEKKGVKLISFEEFSAMLD